MKIRLDVDDKHFEYERDSMPPERFTALCKLAGAAICGGVLLGAVRMIGAWGAAWGVGALLLVGLFKVIQNA